MKAILLSLALALLMAGCSEESRSVGHDGYVEDKTFLSSLHSLKNKRTEFDRIKRLAKGGDKSAQDNIGVMYSIGDGVPQDYKEAVKWFTKAAEQGDADAQKNLGVMFDNGEGVPKDLVQAYAWYNVANAYGQEKAKECRDKIELTPRQLAEAQSLSTEIYKRIEENRQD